MLSIQRTFIYYERDGKKNGKIYILNGMLKVVGKVAVVI